jgi:hypothetical protein
MAPWFTQSRGVGGDLIVIGEVVHTRERDLPTPCISHFDFLFRP